MFDALGNSYFSSIPSRCMSVNTKYYSMWYRRNANGMWHSSSPVFWTFLTIVFAASLI
jgi:hypothetical protein